MKTFFVRGASIVFRRSALEDEINRGWNFGLDNSASVHRACCSAEESLRGVTRGSDEARQAHFAATPG
ncbi:MAG: hypothetical protein SH868_13925 [Bythopirellula sp.]|nr:hypothetical protein [Bythopirellula sp.]